MRFLLPSVFLAAVLGATAFAQEPTAAKPAEKKLAQNTAAAATPKPARKAEPVKPAASAPSPVGGTPAPKRNILQRVFGGKGSATPGSKAIAATPAPAPAPAAPVTTHPRKQQAHRSESNDDGTKSAAAAENAGGKKPDGNKPALAEEANASKTAESEKPPEGDKSAEKAPDADSTVKAIETTPPPPPPAGKKGRKKGPPAAARAKEGPTGVTKEQLALQEAQASGDADAIEKAKYNEVKARAQEDPQVKELKQKADAAPPDQEGGKASKAYYRALFGRMRAMSDKDIADRINSMEKAVMKDLGED